MYNYQTLETLTKTYRTAYKNDLKTTLFGKLEKAIGNVPNPTGKILSIDSLGYSAPQLADFFLDTYLELCTLYRYDPDDVDSFKVMFEKLQDKINAVFARNASVYSAILYTALQTYNPIDNYSMIEQSVNATNLSKTNTTNTYNVTNTNSNSTTIGNLDSADYIYSYDNGTEAQPQATHKTGQQSNSSTDTNSNSGTSTTETDYMTQTHVEIDVDGKTKGFSGNTTNQNILTRKGNIGVTTTTQMLEQYQKLKKDFIDLLFSDVANEILLHIYL